VSSRLIIAGNQKAYSWNNGSSELTNVEAGCYRGCDGGTRLRSWHRITRRRAERPMLSVPSWTSLGQAEVLDQLARAGRSLANGGWQADALEQSHLGRPRACSSRSRLRRPALRNSKYPIPKTTQAKAMTSFTISIEPEVYRSGHDGGERTKMASCHAMGLWTAETSRHTFSGGPDFTCRSRPR
jgi:hypothetical protein